VITHYSAATLARAAGGQVLPTLRVTLAYVAGCGGDVTEWQSAWAEVSAWAGSRRDERAAGRPSPPRPAHDAPAAAPVSAGAVPGDHAPAQLPADTADFTGRGEQVGLLCGLLGAAPAADRPGAVVISAVSGMGGIGKTALAVHAAHRLRDQFPDGQLFAGLQGATSPMRPTEVLARFLRGLGVPDAGIPAGEAERAARYRTALAARRVLIVLDDARDAAQVRPLLPGTSGCGVIVTSRSGLPGLSGAALLGLGALARDEARDLLTAIVGAERAAAEPAAVDRVLECCAGLPLAVRIAASRLALRPGWSIAHLAAKLRGERVRLAELAVGDQAVRASFAVSYDALPAAGGDAAPARVFRLLGLANAAVLSLPAAAALVGQPAADVAAALEILTDAHLVECPAPDRFRPHDLLRSYAAELAGQVDGEDDRNAAVDRMLRWYGEQAVVAARVLAPARRLPAAVLSQPAIPAGPAEPAQALDWFETELANLVAAVRQAADRGAHDVAAQIAIAMWDFFQRTPYQEDWLAICQAGVNSARHLGDDAVLSQLLNSLGQVYSKFGRFADSRRCLTEALAIRRRAGDRTGEAKMLNSLALDLCDQGRFAESLGYLRSALAIHTALGEQPNVGVVLNNIGLVLQRLKRHGEALDYLGQALVILQETGDRFWESKTEGALGDTYLDLGRFEDAVEHYRRAQAALRDTAPQHADQADVLCGLGSALDALGRAAEARDAWLTAIPILDRLDDPRATGLRGRLAGPGAAPGPDPS
jgi:tetratricopeptide (TPR) repeat protein